MWKIRTHLWFSMYKILLLGDHLKSWVRNKVTAAIPDQEHPKQQSVNPNTAKKKLNKREFGPRETNITLKALLHLNLIVLSLPVSPSNKYQENNCQTWKPTLPWMQHKRPFQCWTRPAYVKWHCPKKKKKKGRIHAPSKHNHINYNHVQSDSVQLGS